MARHHQQFGHEDFQYGFEIALGATYRGAADAGEVLATAARIKDGDADAWVREWLATADAVRAQAEEAKSDVTALAHHRRAATYYSTALYVIDASKESDRQLEIWRRGRESWDRIVDLSRGERISIPYEGTTLPGWFFRAADERRPLVVVNNGSDGPTSAMWVLGGAAAGERGYHWMTFDGPGQQETLFERGIPFRHDWEAVLTPVLDAMAARDDVDPDRIAVIGISQGGYWVPRALAFEHRFAAAVADPGVVDVSTSWLEHLPGRLRKELQEGKKDSFDKEMRIGERFSPSARAVLTFRAAPYAIESGSRFDLYQAVMRYRLGDEVARIRTPLLICDPEGEQFWPGQPQQLYDRLDGPKEIVRFTAAEGAGGHCEPLGGSLRDARVFDWLDRYLG